MLPTVARAWEEQPPQPMTEGRNNGAAMAGYFVGSMAGFAGAAAQGIGYIKAVESGHPYLLAIPVVTNAASYVCENAKKIKAAMTLFL